MTSRRRAQATTTRHPMSAAGRVQAALAGRSISFPGSDPDGSQITPPPQPARRWSRPARLAIGTGAVLLVGAVAMLVVLALGRPKISMSASGQSVVRVEVGGLGTQLTALHAWIAGRPVSLVQGAGGLVPAAPLAQGQTVQVTATASAPGWLRWLVGSGVSTSKTVRTPAAATSATIVLTSKPGMVAVRFDHPVSVVEYRSGGGAWQIVRLHRPATVADLPVPSQAAGSLTVAAAPLPWEKVAAQPRTVTWFVAPPGGEPVALADPAPGSATATSGGPITLTFDQSVAKTLGATRPTLSPAVPGSWSQPGPDTLVFTPSGFGFGPGTSVTVALSRPVSILGETTTVAATTPTSTSYQFAVAPGSVLRLEQILAQLGYLPLRFTPAAGVHLPTTFAGEVASMTKPLAGTLSWRWASTPATLQAQWAVGQPNALLKGALMAFAAAQNNYDGYQQEGESVAQLASALDVGGAPSGRCLPTNSIQIPMPMCM